MKKVGIGSIIYSYYNFGKYEIILESEQYYILRKIQNNKNCITEEDTVKKSCVNSIFGGYFSELGDIEKRLERERNELKEKEKKFKNLVG